LSSLRRCGGLRLRPPWFLALIAVDRDQLAGESLVDDLQEQIESEVAELVGLGALEPDQPRTAKPA
jgi:hypothetical protein